MIKYQLSKKKVETLNRMVYAIEVDSTLIEKEDVFVTACLAEIQDVYTTSSDAQDLVNGLEELIDGNVPDFSRNGLIITVRLKVGSRKSKIIGVRGVDTPLDIEFETKDFLKMCEDWRDFLIENGR